MANRLSAFFRPQAARLGAWAQAFIWGPAPAKQSPTATIENRTAWRILIGPVGAAGQPAAASPAGANGAELRHAFQGRPLLVVPKSARLGRTRPRPVADRPPPEQLILAPFAWRKLTCEELERYDYESWKKRGFVTTYREPVPRPVPRLARTTRGAAWVVFFATLLALLVASPLAPWAAAALTTLFTTSSPLLNGPLVPPALWGPPWLYWAALGLSAVGIWLFDGAAIRRWASQVTSFLSVVLISLALSLGFFLLFTRDPTAHTPLLANSVTVQAGIAVVFFVVLASSIPALLYYLFERQRSATARAIFLRDAIRLNPNIFTLDEAEYRYGTLANEVYSRKPSQDFLGGLQVSLLVNLALTTLGWSLALMPNVGHLPATVTPYEAVPLLITPFRDPIVFGALGSYFFALNLLFRRYVRADLSAKAYTHVVMRQLLTVILVWAISVPTQWWNSLGAWGQDALLVLAFFVGIVPETALAFLQDYLRRLQGSASWLPAFAEKQPLDDLDGVTLYDRARLLEEGIENIENLAHHNFIELMLRAHLPTPRLADLVDQAILYLHLYEPAPLATAAPGAPATDPKTAAEAPAPTARATLRRFGLRTATDLERAYDQACGRGAADVQRLLSILDEAGRPAGRLQTVLDALGDDDWMPYLREWHENRRGGQAMTLAQALDRIQSAPPARDCIARALTDAPQGRPNGSGSTSAGDKRAAEAAAPPA